MELMPELVRRELLVGLFDVVVMAMQQNDQEIYWVTQAGLNEIAFLLSYQTSSCTYIDNRAAQPYNFSEVMLHFFQGQANHILVHPSRLQGQVKLQRLEGCDGGGGGELEDDGGYGAGV